MGAGSYSKVTVDAKGRIVMGFALSLGDIPSFTWNKITNGKPTTLAGYGITNGVKSTGDSVTGKIKTTLSPSVSNHAVTLEYLTEAVNGVPVSGPAIGAVVEKATSVTPSGYLRCNGGEVSKTTYADLYAIVGDKFGGDLTIGNGQPWRKQYVINDQQSADITGWTTGTSIPAVRRSSQVIVTKNRVYLLGGDNTSGTSATVYTTSINLDGTLGTWVASANLPGALGYSVAIVTKNRVYLPKAGRFFC